LETYQITSAVLGFTFAVLILWLVRRDHMHGRFGLWWLLVAVLFAVLGLAPPVVDRVAVRLGIAYPPILVVILGIGFLVLKMIIMDIERSRSIARLERLAQRLAVLEERLTEHDHDQGHS